MKEEFVTYNQALALKELGFDEDCLGRWLAITEWEKPTGEIKLQLGVKVEDYDKNQCLAPLYQQAFRWFREKHNLYSEINLDSYKEPYSLKVIIKHLDNTNTFVDKEYYPYSNGIGDIDNKKHEEAESACLDKLIEICLYK